MKHISLSISGFCIELKLHTTEYLQSQGHFLAMLNTYYSGFINRSSCRKVDFTIHVIQENEVRVLKDKKRSYVEFYRNTPDPFVITTFYAVSLEQFAQLLKYILYELLPKSGFFLHCAAVATRDGKGKLLVGQSGAGKSTMLAMLKDDVIPLADDICIIRKMGNAFMCFQTPFLDKQVWIPKHSQGYEVHDIYFLRKSNETYLQPVEFESVQISLISELVSNSQTVKAFTKNLFLFIKRNVRASFFHFEKDKKKVLAAMMLASKVTSTATTR